jgi:hypothetical protein
MKILIIICSHEFNVLWRDNIQILNEYAKLLGMEVEYCGISNQDDFYNYESIISFKYKIINTKRQFSKICDFITDYKSELDYDWYMKIRPDVKLLENINFDLMSEDAINARAREYYGPRKIKYGTSINGEGCWKNIVGCHYASNEHSVVLDDMLFVFHKNIIQLNGFDKIEPERQGNEEWNQTTIFKSRNIPLNVIGIYLVNTKYDTYSGDIG